MTGLEHLFLDLDGQPAGRAKRWARALIALALAAIPLAVTVANARDRAGLRRRPAVPCVITASGVDTVADVINDGKPYRPWVTFTFDYQGRRCHGNRLTTGPHDPGTDDAAAAYATAAGYMPGTSAVCRVHGTDLAASVLDRPPDAWEPCVVPAAAVVLAAVAGLYCWPQVRLGWTAAGRVPPGDDDRQRRAAYIWGGLLFLGAGPVIAVWWAIPLTRTASARHWPAVPCVVESSRVRPHTDYGEMPLTSYRTDVLYRYAVAGRTYHSNCYNLTEGASLARGGRDRAAAAFPAGPAVCYVDPADPTAATLTRHVSPTVAFAAWPLAVALLGLIGLIDGGVGRVSRALVDVARRSKVTLAVLAVAVVGLTVWGVFGTP